MNKLMTALCLLMFLSIGVFAQNQVQNDDEDYNKNEVYVGFAPQRADKAIDLSLRGFEVAYTRNLNRYFGVKGSFTAGFDKDEFVFNSALPNQSDVFVSEVDRQRYSFMGGIQVKDNAAKKRFKPFGHLLAGAVVTRSNTGQIRCLRGTCNSSVFFPNNPFTETRFAVAVGGGIDVKINRKIDIRAIQVDYNPIFFSGFTQNNLRFGFGIVIK